MQFVLENSGLIFVSVYNTAARLLQLDCTHKRYRECGALLLGTGPCVLVILVSLVTLQHVAAGQALTG